MNKLYAALYTTLVLSPFGQQARAAPTAESLVRCGFSSVVAWSNGEDIYVGYLRPADTTSNGTQAVLSLPESRQDGYAATVYGTTNDSGSHGLVIKISQADGNAVKQTAVDDLTQLPVTLSYHMGNRFLSVTCALSPTQPTHNDTVR